MLCKHESPVHRYTDTPSSSDLNGWDTSRFGVHRSNPLSKIGDGETEGIGLQNFDSVAVGEEAGAGVLEVIEGHLHFDTSGAGFGGSGLKHMPAEVAPKRGNDIRLGKKGHREEPPACLVLRRPLRPEGGQIEVGRSLEGVVEDFGRMDV